MGWGGVGGLSAAVAVRWWRRRPCGLISFCAGVGPWREEDRDGLVGVVSEVSDVVLVGVRGRVR